VIYAIRAVGTEFVKIGKASSVGRRLKELDTACPHELHIEAAADWPDQQESAIHLYLKAHCEKFEWFRDSAQTIQVIGWLRAQEEGLRQFRVMFLEFARANGRMPRWLASEFEYPSQKPARPRRVKPAPSVTVWLPPELPRVSSEPQIPMLLTDKERQQANERFEYIKQRVLAKQAAKRSQETISPSSG
jgi:hypothetical protein